MTWHEILWFTSITVVLILDIVHSQSDNNGSNTNDEENVKAKSYWPDLRCVGGWPEESSWNQTNLTSSKVEAKGFGLAKFDMIYDRCINRFPDSDPITDERPIEETIRCQKLCMLDGLKLIERNRKHKGEKDYASNYTLAHVETFLHGLRTILTGQGWRTSIAKIRSQVYPVLKSTWPENLRSKCSDKKWDTLFANFDRLIKGISNESCQVETGIIEDEQEDHLNIDVYKDKYINITAHLDLSCYSDFEYMGREEGSLEYFEQWTEECQSLLNSAGVSDVCHQSCMLGKMGIFTFVLSNGTYVPHLRPKDMLQFFTGPTSNITAPKLGSLINDQCKKAMSLVELASCTEWDIFFDCIERVMSCNYTRKFTRQNSTVSQTSDKTMGIKHETRFPDLSCRVGYFETTDTNATVAGSRLLTTYKANCSATLPNGYDATLFQECMLWQMGILQLREKLCSGLKYNKTNSPLLNSQEEIKKTLSKLFEGEGGIDTAESIGSKIYSSCTERYEEATRDPDDPNKGNQLEDRWGEFFRCIRKTLDCRGSIFLRTDIAQVNSKR